MNRSAPKIRAYALIDSRGKIPLLEGQMPIYWSRIAAEGAARDQPRIVRVEPVEIHRIATRDTAPADGFIALTDDGERMTCPMPPDETVVDVKLETGTITRAFYFMDSGDWDFVPVGQDGWPDDRDSIADQVVAWRPEDNLRK